MFGKQSSAFDTEVSFNHCMGPCELACCDRRQTSEHRSNCLALPLGHNSFAIPPDYTMIKVETAPLLVAPK